MTVYLPPISYLVTDDEDGYPLKTILRGRMQISRTLLAKLKQTECGIMLNGIRVYSSVIVKAGDLVEVRMEREISDNIVPESMEIEVLFEDEHLLILNKAAGMIVHPTHGHYTGTLANAVVHYWQTKGESVRFRPIHRLDQDTSGVLAVAKNPYVHQHVSEQMIRKEVEKSYVAIIHGEPEPTSGSISAPIDRDLQNPHLRVVTASGSSAVTHYQMEEAYAAASLVRLRLETGRTHQIRVHMKHIGCPLLGDPMYGPDTPTEEAASLHQWIHRQALHAQLLAFRHPICGEFMRFTAPWPEDLTVLRNKLRESYVQKRK